MIGCSPQSWPAQETSAHHKVCECLGHSPCVGLQPNIYHAVLSGRSKIKYEVTPLWCCVLCLVLRGSGHATVLVMTVKLCRELSAKRAVGQEDAQRTTTLPREALAASEDLSGRMARFLQQQQQQQQQRTPSGSGAQPPLEMPAAQSGGTPIAEAPKLLSEGSVATSPGTGGDQHCQKCSK